MCTVQRVYTEHVIDYLQEKASGIQAWEQDIAGMELFSECMMPQIPRGEAF